MLKDLFNDVPLVNEADLCGAPHKLMILISPEHLGQAKGFYLWDKGKKTGVNPAVERYRRK